ncbi:MAG: C4-type zinc ribbon domain-containing protein [Desulfosoma sp.]
MQEQLKYLVELQILENKKAELIRKREETPLRIAALDKEFAAFESEYLLKKTEHDNAVQLRRAEEKEIADLEARIRRSRQKEHEVKTNREYHALLKEIQDLQDEINAREDHILELMEKIENLSKELKTLAQEVEKRRKAVEDKKAALQQECDQVDEKIARLEALQADIRTKLSPLIFNKWNTLAQRYKGVAVAPVTQGVCQICHLNIPPQRFIELLRDQDILTCPHCHRFIYHPENEAYRAVHENFKDF